MVWWLESSPNIYQEGNIRSSHNTYARSCFLDNKIFYPLAENTGAKTVYE
jgi:hypothetical protein